MKRVSLLISFLLCIVILTAQPICHIYHYGLSQGLPQRSVMSMMQDSKGFMWFGTWDGLCKFDGYNFTNYKTSEEDSISIKNYRIDKICEDKFGYIWINTYNKETFRFDPSTGKYISTFHINNQHFLTTDIYTMRSGSVWLSSEKSGVLCVPDSTAYFKVFSEENKTLVSNHINLIIEDEQKNTWILTNQGLTCISPTLQSQHFFTDAHLSFTTAHENMKDIWFGTDQGTIWCYNKSSNTFNLFDAGVESAITSINKIYDKLLVVTTSKDGFFICDQEKINLRNFNSSNLKNLPSTPLLASYVDQNHNIWFDIDIRGVAKFNLLNNTLKVYHSPFMLQETTLFDPNFMIAEDPEGRIWVHPKGGGFSLYNAKEDKLVPFHDDPTSDDYRFSDQMHTFLVDKQGILWLSPRSGGIEKVVFTKEQFDINNFSPNFFIESGSEVRSIMQDKQNNIWIGHKGTSEVLVYKADKTFIGFLCSDGSISPTGTPLKILAYSMLQDKEGNIWIGTKGQGVLRLQNQTNDEKFSIRQFMNHEDDPYSLSGNSVYTIHQDIFGRLWIGTYDGGINIFDDSKNRFLNHQNILKNYPIQLGFQVRSINSSEQNIYIGTTAGLVVAPIANRIHYGSLSFTTYSGTQTGGIQINDIFHIYVSRQRKIYLASFGEGLMEISNFDTQGLPAAFKVHKAASGLQTSIVQSIIEDREANLWIIAEGNLFRFNPEDDSFKSFNSVGYLLGNHFFSEAIPIISKNNELLIGFTNGIFSFKPSDLISHNEFIPYLSITNLHISGKKIPYSDYLSNKDKLILTHRENILNIEFAALDYTNPETIFYAYKLEGFDDDWIYSKRQRVVNYTKLLPGKYTLKVKSTNSDGTWVDNERILHFEIKQSCWKSGWAFLMYGFLVTSFLIIIFRSVFIYYRMKDKLLLDAQETDMKDSFFTNISHEIRTPLTMIAAPLENIIENKPVSDDIRSELKLILRNTSRMLTLVNQILDFRKIQRKKLQVKEILFGNFVLEICNNFTKTVEHKNIQLIINDRVDQQTIWGDSDRIEKLVYNLLSNAIKFTPEGKKIEVNIFHKDHYMVLQVKDEGKGMSREIINKIFTRYASFNTDKSNPSTGIGLSIVHEVAEKHHAKIVVESEINRGATFEVLFQTGLNHFIKDNQVEICYDLPEHTISDTFSEQAQKVTNNLTDNKVDKKNKETVLIVEDDDDLRQFIRSVLEESYQIHEASNGKEALGIVNNILPDLIISDIMMPEMDGVEFLEKVRDNLNTCHIPFILLTAKTNIDDQLKGIRTGADDYITKPFSVSMLKSKLNNLLLQRKRMAAYLAGKQDLMPCPDESELKSKISPKDEEFLNLIQNEIEQNLLNDQYKVEELVACTNFSRRVFFNKLKTLTGLAPVEFIRQVRLKQAAIYLRTGEYLIKEVVYMVGFNDLRYFSNCFKELYGMTPKEFREQNK